MTLERIVALKMLATQLSMDSGYVQRFVKEARAAARLNHPNIVQIYNFGKVESTYFLAMEFVNGHSLGYYLKHGHVFSESDALQIVRQVGRALAVAHAEGLVHRDIKPDNLMLTNRGEVKIVDLGIAKRVDEDQSITQSGTSIGTPHYISPEQIRGQKDIDARADVYSLGATFYHLVTGHTPFQGSSGPLVMSMHLVDPLPDPRTWVPTLSEGLCRVLRKMMAKKREERYLDMAFLDVDLHRLQAGQTPMTAEPSLSALSTAQLPGGRPTAPTPQPPAFDSVVLARIEESLSQAIGPMARIIVRKSAKTATSLDALCEALALHLAPGSERETFFAKCLACGKTPPPAVKAATGPARTPAAPRAWRPGPRPRPQCRRAPRRRRVRRRRPCTRRRRREAERRFFSTRLTSRRSRTSWRNRSVRSRESSLRRRPGAPRHSPRSSRSSKSTSRDSREGARSARPSGSCRAERLMGRGGRPQAPRMMIRLGASGRRGSAVS